MRAATADTGLAFIALIIAANYISSRHHRRLDLTSEKIYSLSSQSEQVVKNLKEPVKLIAMSDW